MYKILRTILFLFPAETAHSISMNFFKVLCSIGLIREALQRSFSTGPVNTTCFGLTFRNPIGLAAGFDKNARYIREIEVLGFGFIEIGTVTPRPQKGNDKPRLFRLPKDRALINRMGFNNDGVEKVVARLKGYRSSIVNRQTSIVNRESSISGNRESSIVSDRGSGIVNRQSSISGNRESVRGDGGAESYQPTTDGRKPRFLIGGNIGKNKTTPNEDAWKDYEICFRALHPYVDFFIVNVSSPNTPGLRELQEKEALKKILTHLQLLNKQFEIQRPVLLKIAPDLSQTQIDDVIDLAKEIKLDGIVATNTTINRSTLSLSVNELEKIGPGGLSGKPITKKSTEVIRYLSDKLKGTISVIASGGIFTIEDVKEKMEAGGSLFEVYTGFIYEGPFIVHKLCKAFKEK